MTGDYNYAAISSSSMSIVLEYFGGRSWPSATCIPMHNHMGNCTIQHCAYI